MEYQKVINFLGNTTNQPSKFKTKHWVGINDGSYGVYSTGSQIKFKVYVIIVTSTYLLTVSNTGTIVNNIQKLSSIYWLHKGNKQ